MKKYFYLLLLVLLFPVFVYAEECDSSTIIIKSIELKEVEGNALEKEEASIEKNKINLDIKLYDPKDSLKYDIKVKNESKEDYYFNEEELKQDTDYLKYEFNYEDNSNLIKSNEEKNITLRIEYKERVPEEKLTNGLLINTDNVKLDVVTKEIEPAPTKEPTNIDIPDTFTNSPLYIVVLLVVSVAVIILIKEKKNKTLVLILGILLIYPLYVDAVCEVKIEVNAKVEIDGKEAYFLTGPEVNVKMKQLAGNDTSTDNEKTTDSNVTKILHSDTEPSTANKQEKNIMSTADSPYPIYMWYEDGTIYWWSEDITPNVNENAVAMFRNYANLVDITGLQNLDTSNTTNMRQMLAGTSAAPMKLESLKTLSNWDTSDATDMSYMFMLNTSLTTLEGLEKWDVSNVETMYGMFMGTVTTPMKLESLKALSNWDTSSVTNMRAMFQLNISLTTLEGLENWNVSNVEIMRGMFIGEKPYYMSITSLKALSNWDTSNVTNMYGMFGLNASLTTLEGLENWDTSKVETMEHMFNKCSSITNISALSNWDVSKVENFDYMFAGNASYQMKITSLKPLKNWNTSSATSMGSMFRYNTSLTSLEGLEKWDVSNVTNFSEGNDKYNRHSEGTFESLTSLSDASAIDDWDIREDAFFNNMFKNTPVHPEFSKVSGFWDNGTFAVQVETGQG